jgi:hypothetical protein
VHNHLEIAGVDCQKPCRRKVLMQRLDFVAVVVLSICRNFFHFVMIDGRAELPTVKF